MYFSSDNWGGVHPRIAQSLTEHSDGFAAPYGASELDRRVVQKFNEIFEREVAVCFVGTGTAANSLSMVAVNRPGGVVFCHQEAHMIVDECGAPELFTQGARLVPVNGAQGKLDLEHLTSAIDRFPAEFVHAGRPMAVSLTQATELGAVYTPDEISAISAICREKDMALHVDGARFANALVHSKVSPAELTWKSGVDLMSFGATKNGCWCAEALIIFDPDKAADLPFIQKRAAQLFSKNRFISAQFDAYFSDDLWLELARTSNKRADQLRAGIENSSNARLAWPTHSNEVFIVLTGDKVRSLQQQGAQFYDWTPPHGMDNPPGQNEVLARLVTSFANTADDVDKFLSLLG